MMTKEQATRKANALRKRMTTSGWKIHVWENMGWHYYIERGTASIHPSSTDGKFFCFISSTLERCGAGAGIWTTHNRHGSDPNKVYEIELRSARTVLAELAQAVALA